MNTSRGLTFGDFFPNLTEGLAIFPSPAGMPFTKLFLAGNK